MPKPRKILIIRNDKIGDFTLSLPVYRYIKTAAPDIHICVLVPEYTSDIARLCTDIDQILIDPQGLTGLQRLLAIYRLIRNQQFDAAITLFSTTLMAIALLLARISYRLAPATKLGQIFYNHRLTQRRSRSEKPEYEYNLDLAKTFLHDFDIPLPDSTHGPYLSFDTPSLQSLKTDFCSTHTIDTTALLVFVHCGSGGSANNLGIDQYAELAERLTSDRPLHIVATAGPDELDTAWALSNRIHNHPVTVFHSVNGLEDFCKHIAICDCFISGSTGPLHLAGALNRPTAGFFPRRRSATALRWQTINDDALRLSFSPDEQVDAEDMQGVDISYAAKMISQHFL